MSDEQPPKKRAPRKTPAKKTAPVEPMDAAAPLRPRQVRKKGETTAAADTTVANIETTDKVPQKARAPRKRAAKLASVDEAALTSSDVGAPPARPKPMTASRKPRARVTAPIAGVPVQASLPMPPASESESILTSAAERVAPEPAANLARRPAAKPLKTAPAPEAAARPERVPTPAPRPRRESGRTPPRARQMAVRNPAVPTATSTRTVEQRVPTANTSAIARWRRWRALADPYLRLCRLDRPIGFLLLLWPTWWGLWAAAEGFPPWHLLIVFTLGVVFMRSAGCVINDYADRWLDPRVARTKTRPLANGEVAPRNALLLFVALLIASFGLVLLTNPLTIKLAFVGAFLAATYPFLKRYTHLPQVYLGIAFGWSIPMAFAAIQDEVPRLAWLLFLANILWTTAYDTLYAMVDREDDLKAGAKSTAILFGDIDLIAVAMMQGAFVLTMVFVGQRLALDWPYWLALALAVALFAWQHWCARRRDREGCFRAFLDNNYVGMVVFAGLAAALAMR